MTDMISTLSEGVENPGLVPVEGAEPLEGANPGDPNAATLGDVETKEGAPETYGDFEFPEGFDASEDALERFKEMAKGANLSQEAAQQLVGLQTELMQGFVDNQATAWEELRKEWVNTSKTDKEIGGINFSANLAVAKEPLKNWGSPELLQMLNDTGVGDHPEMLKFMYRLGKAMKEDKMHVGGNPHAGQKTQAQVLYGS